MTEYGRALIVMPVVDAWHRHENSFMSAPTEITHRVELVVHAYVREQVDQLAEHDLVQRRSRITTGKRALQFLVARNALDRLHGVVDQLADLGRLGAALQLGGRIANDSPLGTG